MSVTSHLLLLLACFLCTLATSESRPKNNFDDLEDDLYSRQLPGDTDALSPTDLRKLLLKKLRFREIIDQAMLSPSEIANAAQDSITEDRHNTAKRHKTSDLMSKVKTLLKGIKERQIKDAMQLPSLRFGRSGYFGKR